MNPADAAENGLVDVFSDSEELDGAVSDLSCPSCGTSLLDLYKDGRMGCAECYVTFKSQVHRALIVLHGAHMHIGKSINSALDY